MSALRFAIFDVDGTLADSFHNIVSSVEEVCTAHGIKPPSADKVRNGVGLSVEEAFKQFVPLACSAKIQNLSHDFKEVIEDKCNDESYVEPLYPGTLECLKALEDKDILLGIATGNSKKGLQSFLKRQGLENTFINLKTADEYPSKPSPQMLLQAMKETGAEPENTVMIGDTVYDILMAGNAGIASIGVSWGSHDIKRLKNAGASAIVESFDEIEAVFDRLTNKEE